MAAEGASLRQTLANHPMAMGVPPAIPKAGVEDTGPHHRLAAPAPPLAAPPPLSPPPPVAAAPVPAQVALATNLMGEMVRMNRAHAVHVEGQINRLGNMEQIMNDMANLARKSSASAARAATRAATFSRSAAELEQSTRELLTKAHTTYARTDSAVSEANRAASSARLSAEEAEFSCHLSRAHFLNAKKAASAVLCDPAPVAAKAPAATLPAPRPPPKRRRLATKQPVGGGPTAA